MPNFVFSNSQFGIATRGVEPHLVQPCHLNNNHLRIYITCYECSYYRSGFPGFKNIQKPNLQEVLIMVKVKNMNDSKEAYRQGASVAPERYKKAVLEADWQTNAASNEAEDLYAERVQQAISAKRRQKAINKISNSEWQNRASTKGANAIGQAMRDSDDKWAKAFTPYAEALEGISLPPRSSDPMSNIDNRLKKVVQTLVDKKKSIKG